MDSRLASSGTAHGLKIEREIIHVYTDGHGNEDGEAATSGRGTFGDDPKWDGSSEGK